MDDRSSAVTERQRKNSGTVGQSLYEKRQKIYPREVHGVFAGLRVTATLGLLAIYYVFPWLRWDGRQLLLLDLPARKFYLFGWTFWPQDFLFLAFLLVLAALCLFFFTTLAGRLWCGYACPQTVWTEAFLWIERVVEGSRARQMRLDQAPSSFKKIRIKTTKHALWILFSAYTGFTFIAYFTPSADLVHDLVRLELGPWQTFWMIFYGFATYGNAGWMREQVCIHMCPYARFQSAMFDQDTLIISYDEKRGEPRGSRNLDIDHRGRGLGDCIDCTLCVQVCPTGIDIRDGLQYECIGCSACIDVCNDVMGKVGYPKGLIRYTTQNAIEGKTSRLLRPRPVIYGAILTGLSALFLYMLSQRTPLALDVIRDRNQLYRESAGLIENVYTLKVINMDHIAHEYALTAEGIPDLELRMDGGPILVASGNVIDVAVGLRAREDALKARSNDITFRLTATDNAELTMAERAKFLGPRP